MLLPRLDRDWASCWWLPPGTCTSCQGCGELDASRLPVLYTPPGVKPGRYFSLSYVCRNCGGTGTTKETT